ncbi:hypothetical protein [Actinomadura sp. 3N508]|uniref:hypothetical protein n=1 Tax=Actinomadura sp. 3N508 TaxID=3375153 RepID=UPI0037895A3E
MDPSLGVSNKRDENKWDALADSFWEGSHITKSDHVAILRLGPTKMAKENPIEYETAIDVLKQVARLSMDIVASVGALAVVIFMFARTIRPML